MASSVSWRQDATTRRWLRLPLLLGVGLLYGVQVLVLGAGVLALSWWLDPRLGGVAVAGGALGGATYVLGTTRGTVDPEAATLRVAAREYDLGPVTDYRIRRLGPVALVTLSAPSRPGRFGSVPSRFRVPPDRLDAVTAALDAVVAAEPTDPGRESNPQVRLVGGALALLFGAAGAAAVAAVGSVVGWYVGAVCWLFAGILLFVAREG